MNNQPTYDPRLGPPPPGPELKDIDDFISNILPSIVDGAVRSIEQFPNKWPYIVKGVTDYLATVSKYALGVTTNAFAIAYDIFSGKGIANSLVKGIVAGVITAVVIAALPAEVTAVGAFVVSLGINFLVGQIVEKLYGNDWDRIIVDLATDEAKKAFDNLVALKDAIVASVDEINALMNKGADFIDATIFEKLKDIIEIHLRDAGMNNAADLFSMFRDSIHIPKLNILNPLFIDSAFFKLKVSPLVLDINGDGIKTVALSDTYIHFDLDGNRHPVRTGWISDGDGFLAYDKDENGKIENIGELFGANGEEGFAKLAVYDLNRDSKIDINDQIYQKLLVWIDKNSNGVTDPQELFFISELGIKTIYISDNSNVEIDNGNLITDRSLYEMSDGSFRDIADVWFTIDPSDRVSTAEAEHSFSNESLLIPDIKNQGLVDGLRYTYDINIYVKSLLNKVLGEIGTANETEVFDDLKSMLYYWASVQDRPINDRGTDIDSRILGVVERFYGQELRVTDIFGNIIEDGDIRGETANTINKYYQKLSNSIMAELDSQIYKYKNDGNTPVSYVDHLLHLANYDNSSGLLAGDPLHYMYQMQSYLDGTENSLLNPLDIIRITRNLFVMMTQQGMDVAVTARLIELIADNVESSASAYIRMYVEGISKLWNESSTFTVIDSGKYSYIGSSGLGIWSNNGNDPSDYYYVVDDKVSATVSEGLTDGEKNGFDIIAIPFMHKSEITLGREGYNLHIGSIKGSTFKIEIIGFFGINNSGIDRLVLKDDKLDRYGIRNLYISMQNDDGNNNIEGTEEDDIISLGKGDDVITSYSGNDIFKYEKGSGNDVLYATSGFVPSGNNTLQLEGVVQSEVNYTTDGYDIKVHIHTGMIYDTIVIRANREYFEDIAVKSIVFGDGTKISVSEAFILARAAQITDGNDDITGTAGADIMRGGKGDDHLSGRTGVDTYVYNRGDGNDIVDDGLVFENNNLILHGITVSEMKVAFVGYDVVVSFAESDPGAGDAGSIRFRADSYWHAHALGTISFDDGTVLTPAQWASIGQDNANVFHAGDGDRIVDARFTDTAVHGFLLHGYTPEQVNVTGIGYLGQITLAMTDPTGKPEKIQFEREGTPPWQDGVDQIQFDNGAVWTRDDLRYKAFVDDGTHGSTVTLDTAIYTNQTAFVGGTGDTIYIVGAGLQPVSIADHGGTNALTLRGVSQAQVDFSHDAQSDELVVAIHDVPGRSDSVVKFAHGLDSNGLAAVNFDDGTMTAAEIQNWIDNHHLAA